MLYQKECKKTAKSIVFWIMALVLFCMYLSSYAGEDGFAMLKEPVKGQASYGTKMTDDSDVIMANAAKDLCAEYMQNRYTTCLFLFNRVVKLKKQEQHEMAGIICELTDLTKDRLESKEFTEDVKIRENLSYSEFLSVMKKADDIIGGGSHYSKTNLKHYYGEQDRSYAEALKDYQDVIQKDKVSGAYARYFCDTLGVFLGILPVFLTVSLCWKERGSKKDIYACRKMNSWKVIGARYLALVSMIMAVVFVLALISMVQVAKMYPHTSLDWMAFFRYSLVWLLPTVLAVTAMGTFLGVLTENVLVLFVQVFVWISSLYGSIHQMKGGYRGGVVFLRHNVVGFWDVYHSNLSSLVWNRLMYTALAAVLFVLTVLVYEQRRKGRLYGTAGFKHRIAH